MPIGAAGWITGGDTTDFDLTSEEMSWLTTV